MGFIVCLFFVTFRKAFHTEGHPDLFGTIGGLVVRALWAVVSLVRSASLNRRRVKRFIYPVCYLSSNQLLFLLHFACIIARVSDFM